MEKVEGIPCAYEDRRACVLHSTAQKPLDFLMPRMGPWTPLV